MKRIPSSFALIVLIGLTACMEQPDSAYFNRGGPESLLDVSSEVVNLNIGSAAEVKSLASWVQQDVPTRAELYCNALEARCKQARQALELKGVPVMVVSSPTNTATLVYERILARDCNQRYIDQTPNHANAPHPAFGCSVAANMVQHVSDKQQFINPEIMDLPSADRPARMYRSKSAAPQQQQQDFDIGKSVVSSASN
jgi:type IV pilus biogenesis protein CpaD/CtpE